VRIVNLPEGYDPDGFIREKGKEVYQKKISQARDALEYVIKREIAAKPVLRGPDKIEIIEKILPIIGTVKNRILLGEYAAEFAELIQIDPKLILGEIARTMKKGDKMKPGGIRQTYSPVVPRAEKQLLYGIMNNSAVRKQFLHKVNPDWFTESPMYHVFIELRQRYMEERDFDQAVNELLRPEELAATREAFENFLADWKKRAHPEDEKIGELLLEIMFDETNQVPEKDVQACLNISHSRKLEKDKKEIEKLIREAEKKRNSKVASDLLRKHSEIQKQILSLK